MVFVLFLEQKKPEAVIFYKKMIGDYYRYMAELPVEPEAREAAAQNVEGAYMDAKRAAEASLPPTHPLRLSLILNITGAC